MGNQQGSTGRGPSGPSRLIGGGSASSVKEHVFRAQKTGVLKLNKAGLKEFPAQLLELRERLRSLDLADNKIEQVCGFVGQFQILKQFHMDRNRLVAVADEIGNLKKLENLTLSVNLLTSIPQTIVGCAALRTLDLSANRLSHFPVAISDLPHLEMADLSRNQLESIPDEVGRCRAIELNLNQNRLNNLSQEVAVCPRLKVLRLEENCLSLAAFSRRVLADSQISLLAIEGNLFQEKEIHHLDGYDAYMDKYTATRKKMY